MRIDRENNRNLTARTRCIHLQRDGREDWRNNDERRQRRKGGNREAVSRERSVESSEDNG